MLEFIEQSIKLLVDKPDEVKVDIVETEQRIIYELTVGDGDYGKVIGKGGRVLNDTEGNSDKDKGSDQDEAQEDKSSQEEE